MTRSDNDSSFGLDIAADVMRNPQLFRIVGAILFVLALVPGFPFVPFVLIGLGLFAASFLVTQKKKSSEWNKTMGTKLALERKRSTGRRRFRGFLPSGTNLSGNRLWSDPYRG